MPTMRMPWSKSCNLQLDLLDAPAAPEAATAPQAAPGASARSASMVPTASLYEDGNNPRTEIPEAELDELADDIRTIPPCCKTSRSGVYGVVVRTTPCSSLIARRSSGAWARKQIACLSASLSTANGNSPCRLSSIT
jgi:hypothetical protein